MGVRMLAVYGLPLGLLLSGPLVEWASSCGDGTLYSALGIVFTLLHRGAVARRPVGSRSAVNVR